MENTISRIAEENYLAWTYGIRSSAGGCQVPLRTHVLASLQDKEYLGVSVEQANKGGAHRVPARKVVEKDWLCRFRPTTLDLSLGPVENDT